MKKMRLPNKFIALCAVTFIVGIMCGLIFSTFASEPVEVSRVEFVVSKGDTLWAIADAYSGPDRDIRYTIYRIRQLNDLDTAELYPGDVLIIPIYK